MTFGGTNWGHSAAPVVYTSYDYSAGLRETREIRDKLKQMKLLGLFTRVSKDLLKTVMESNGTGNAVSDTAIWTWVLRNPDTDAGFYVLQHDNSRSRDSTTFSVNAKTSTGTISIPNVNLAGRQSKIVVTDYKFGSQTLLYSSAEVLAYANLDVDVLVLYLNVGQVGEFAFKAASNSTFKTFGETTDFKSTTDNGLVKYTFTQTAGTTVVQFSNGVLVYLLDKATAYNFHAPPTTANPDVLPDQHIFVIGPHLVRSVSKDNYGSTIDIIGDSLTSSTIEVYAGSKDIQTISWNGQSIATTQTSFGSLIGNLPGPSTESISLPELTDWKAADSFPEASPTYDDSQWTACDKTTTLSPVKPLTLPVLFSSDYGFYAGQKIYRATFPSTSGNSSNLNITVQSGAAAGFSVWFNGDHIYSHPGNASLNTLSSVISLPRTSLNSTSNSLVVLLDYTGHDQTSVGPAGVENPRGILGASITPSVPTTWKIMGNAGGNLNIDPVRGPMNEGGLYGERLGWHLPSFPTSSWASSSPTTGISKAGVQWYTSTFSLSIPSTLDIPIGIELSADTKVPARVQVWINGYLMAKFVPHIGPQTRFPIPPGVLDTEGGENTIAVSLWAQSDIGAKLDVLRLIGYGVYETGFKVERNTKYLRPQYDEGVRGQKYV